jgi:hypothetical protein
VWARYDGSKYIIQAKRYAASTNTWQTTETDLSEVGQDAEVPQVAMNLAGGGVAVWRRYNTANWITQGILFDGPLVSPTNFTVCKKIHRFPSQTDLMHCFSWDAVENAQRYRIYVDTGIAKLINAEGDLFLGVLVAESAVSINPLVELHGRCPCLSYTYNVVALDKYGDEGSPASVTI